MLVVTAMLFPAGAGWKDTQGTIGHLRQIRLEEEGSISEEEASN